MARRKHQGHPARKSRAYKRESWFRPDKDEQHIREMARRWRTERQSRSADGDGDISGLLAVAAQELVGQIQAAHPELAGEEHAAALAEWFYGVWGMTARMFNPDAPLTTPLPGYLAWREGSRLRAAA